MKPMKLRNLCVFLAVLASAVLVPGAVASAAQAGSADLRISKADSPDPVYLGTQLTYTIGVENLGPTPATGVTVTDNLPSSVNLVSASGPGGPCAPQGRKVTCPLGDLAPLGVVYGGIPATVTIVVAPQRTGTIRNTATVKADQKDPASKNNKATAATRVLAAVTCRGFTANVVGTVGDDVLLGTSGPDVIVARAGNDQVASLAGRDLVCAGAGRDVVRAGLAADRVLGGGGPDLLLGAGGPDVLRGEAGNDLLKGGPGSDRLRGGQGFDRCLGGPGGNSFRGCER